MVCSEIGNRQSAIGNGRGGFTLVEILVAMGVFVILGTALVGLMGAAMGAWRQGEAGRQANERLQALQRQLADDLAAAILDQPPPPDFHLVLDTLHDLPGHPSIVVDPTSGLKEWLAPGLANGRDLSYFGGSGTVILRIRAPFAIGAALLQARTDALDAASAARVLVAPSDPALPDTQDPPPDNDPRWRVFADVNGERTVNGETTRNGLALGGGESDISPAFPDALRGNTLFIKAELASSSDPHGGARFLASDRMRAGGRPVLVLDCYRARDALPPQPRPTFAAWFKDGAQMVTFTRTLPPEAERAGTEVTGRAQVVYRFKPYDASLGKPGLGVVRRTFVAPIPTARSADIAVGELPLPNVVALVQDDEKLIKRYGEQTFVPNVLHLGLSFWGADTTTWEDRPDLGPNYDATTQRSASTEWLSSRYLPEQVQVTAVLEPDRGRRTTTGLAQAIGDNYPSTDEAPLVVASTQGFDAVQRGFDLREKDGHVQPPDAFARDPRHFIKIDGEWLFYSGVGSDTDFILPRAEACRGARGTRPAPHAAGAEVYRGIVSLFTVRIPAYHHWER
ncbi:MAG: type II secretion system protein [Planctomycetes bacterium]|nr:type II secretion system protein [Planctomycetota bacterium]